MEIFDDPDDILYVFESLYNLDEHSPLKYAHVRGNHVPYMNNQWRSAIRKRNSLWRRFAKERTDANYDLYKAQRNLCTSLRRKAIKKYFNNKVEGSQNPADFWKMYRPFLHSKNSGQANNILIKEDGNFINDKKVLAELFNDYCVNILEDANEITGMEYATDFLEHPSIREILHNKVERETFNFDLVNPSQVDHLLSSINSRKSCGHDMLHPKLLKLSAPVIALPVSKIINSSIISCCYPVRWKMGQVTPLFKKEDELYKKNY